MRNKILITLLAAILWKLTGDADKWVQARFVEIKAAEQSEGIDTGIPLEDYFQEVD